MARVDISKYFRRYRRKIAPVLNKILKLILRVIAVLSSVVALGALVVALLFVNLDSLVAWTLNRASDKNNATIAYDRLHTGFEDTRLTLQIDGLSVIGTDPDEQLEFSAESVKLQLAFPVINPDGLHLAYFGVKKPQLSGEIIIDPQDISQSHRQDVERSSVGVGFVPALSRIHELEIEKGTYDVKLMTENLEFAANGNFEMDGRYYGGRYRLAGSLDSPQHGVSNVRFYFNASETAHGSTDSNLKFIARKVDAVWLATIWNNIQPALVVDPDNVTAAIDADITGRWRDETLESVQWDVKVTDPELDGEIVGVKQFKFQSDGDWRFGKNRSNYVDLKFNVVALDMKTVLNRYPAFFSEKFYQHMSERLNSLWLIEGSGEFRGDPLKMASSEFSGLMNATGHFENYSYKFNTKWPPVQDVRGNFTLRGKRLDISLGEGNVHGQQIKKGFAYVDNISVADPILHLNGEIDATTQDAFELFGPQGIVMPGRTEGITDASGTATVALSAQVPLRRGKEFTLNGFVQPNATSIKASSGIEITDIDGKVDFNRLGITAGELTGKVIGGQLKTKFIGSGPKGAVSIAGSASGTASPKALEPLLGSEISDRLEGSFSWKADFSFNPDLDEVSLETQLKDVASKLPSPLAKSSGVNLPFKAFVSTSGDSERTILLSLGPVFEGKLNAEKSGNIWSIHSGAVAVGATDMPDQASSGVVISMSLPEFDYDLWNRLIASSDSPKAVEFNTLASVNASVDTLKLARNRELHDVVVNVEKQDNFWDIDIISQQVIGKAQYISEQFVHEGDRQKLNAQFARCHFPEAQSSQSKSLIDPKNMPVLDFYCDDVKYGQYYLGKGTIVAEPVTDSWEVKSAKFETENYSLESNAKWNFDNSSSISFKLRSADFGKAMKDLGYDDVFESGKGSMTGHMSWSDGLTNWRPGITSGEFSISIESGLLNTGQKTGAVNTIGLLNYDTLLNRISTDISDLGKDGLAYEKISGTGTVTSGQVNIPQIRVQSPGAEINMYGNSDWVEKTHDLKADVRIEAEKSITTIATIAGGPVTGALVYLGKEILDKADVNLFTAKYNITGSWDEPNVTPQAVAPEDQQ